MGNWSKQVSVPVTITDGVNDKVVRIYHADAAANPPFHPRVIMSGTSADGSTFAFDHALSELNLSDEQLTMITGALTACCTAILTLEGFGQ